MIIDKRSFAARKRSRGTAEPIGLFGIGPLSYQDQNSVRMASSSYYRRQAKILFSLSLVTSDTGVAGRLAALAQEYKALAERARDVPQSDKAKNEQPDSPDPAL